MINYCSTHKVRLIARLLHRCISHSAIRTPSLAQTTPLHSRVLSFQKCANLSVTPCLGSSSDDDKKGVSKDSAWSSSGRTDGGSAGDNDGDFKKDGRKPPPDPDVKPADIIVGGLAVLGLLWYFTWTASKQEAEDKNIITWYEFVNDMLAKGEVSRITAMPAALDAEGQWVIVEVHEGAILRGGKVGENNRVFRLKVYNIDRFEQQLHEAEESLGIPVEQRVSVVYRRVTAAHWLVLAGFLGFWLFIGLRMRKSMFPKATSEKSSSPGFNLMNMFSDLQKAPYKEVDSALGTKSPKIKFSDVAGLHEAKAEIQQFVDYLKRPSAYVRLGAKLPKGALLVGPPGCGKTLLAKAVATESTVPFLAVNGTEFVEMIGGLGAARVRDLFKKAKSKAPCIIYIDEIDAIGRKRSGRLDMDSGSDSELEQTLNQLLTEMDGVTSTQGIITIASTNRGETLDKALLRRGRFDRHVQIDLPNRAERVEIFELYMKKIVLAFVETSKVISRLADSTPGFSGADINNVCNEAAIAAATRGAKSVLESDLDHSLERVIGGAEKRSNTMSPHERQVVAYHESGHALVGWLLEHTDALLKVSIIPRTSAALGFAQYTPADRKLHSKEELFDRICMALGGRAAENIVFGKITTGAEDDLKRVTRIAYDQMAVYGMSDVIGPLSFGGPGGLDENKFTKKPFSKKLQSIIDQEASLLVGSAYRRTEDILRNNRDKLETIAKKLLEAEVLHYNDVELLIGAPAFDKKSHLVERVEHVLPAPVSS